MRGLQRRRVVTGMAPCVVFIVFAGSILFQPAGAEQERWSAVAVAAPGVESGLADGVAQDSPHGPAAPEVGSASEVDGRNSVSSFRVFRDKDRLRLRGVIPTTVDRATVIGMVKASFPGLSVSEKTSVDGVAPAREAWLGGVSFALRQLALLETGVAVLQGSELTLQGAAGSAEKFEAVLNALNTERPRGIEVKGVAIMPPSVRPFTWYAQRGQGVVALSGHVPGKAEQEALTGLVGELFPESPLVNAMQVAGGEPVGWGAAARQCLRALSQLQTGSLSVSDLDVRIEGVVEDEGRLKSIQELGRTLPTGFQVENRVKLAPGVPG